MGDQLRIDGGRKLRSTLKRAGADMKELSKLNKRAAGIVAARAKATAPVGPAKGGHIRPTVRAGATQRAGVVRVGTKAKPYGGPTHWGWPARNIKANPWVTEAAAATEPAFVEVYFDGLKTLLGKIEGA